MKTKKTRPVFIATTLVAVTLLAMSGACSQHEPGDYQGGGREIPTLVIGPASGGPVGSDSGTVDVVYDVPISNDVTTFDIVIPE